MDDLEAVRLCAEAIGYAMQPVDYSARTTLAHFNSQTDPDAENQYNPFTNSEQCLALVERFRLNINTLTKGRWLVSTEGSFSARFEQQEDNNLRRCIVLCIAKMQASKVRK